MRTVSRRQGDRVQWHPLLEPIQQRPAAEVERSDRRCASSGSETPERWPRRYAKVSRKSSLADAVFALASIISVQATVYWVE